MRRLTGAALVPALALLGGCIFHLDTRGSDWASHAQNCEEPPGVVGSGVEASEARAVASFRVLELAGGIAAHVTIADRGELVARGDDNLLEYLETTVEGDTLKVGMRPGTYEFRRKMVVDVSVPDLSAAVVLGSGTVDVDGLAGGAFAVTISGSGEAQARGHVDSLDVLVNGSGDANLYGVEAREVHVRVNGSGDIRVNATERLDAIVSGSGDIRFRGNPTTNLSVHGNGSIRSN